MHVEAAVDGGIEEYDAVACAHAREQRAPKYAEIGEDAPGFGEYQKKTDRKIPLVVLNRVDYRSLRASNAALRARVP